MGIQKGNKVAFDYVLTVDGAVVDSSEGKVALEYTHGDGTLIPGLTRQMDGMEPGDEKNFEVSPEEAYGIVNPQAFQKVPVSALPKEIKPAVGMVLKAQDNTGESMTVRISEVKENEVILDFNHPLAGKTLMFKVKIVSVA